MPKIRSTRRDLRSMSAFLCTWIPRGKDYNILGSILAPALSLGSSVVLFGLEGRVGCGLF